MPGKTRKFAQLSPQKQRQSPAKFVRLTEHDDLNERRERAATKIAEGQERVKSIVQMSSPRKSLSTGGAPLTPRRHNGFDSSPATTPISKMPILANFEEWMKMATDNKINAGNSWNFALIDYFHEMSLLREGDSINFQKASVTLDGCVKIYTNRVDSVATETGKLLSGLSSNKEARSGLDSNGDEDAEDQEIQDEDGSIRKTKKKTTRTAAGTTLVKDFAAIQAKKLDMEFFVDPLFKKTSADFDEGGAKGLLLNHLSVDRVGRIVFDASDAINESHSGDIEDEGVLDDRASNIDFELLGSKFFPELFNGQEESFEDLHICPFLKNFESESSVLDIPLLPMGTSNQLREDLAGLPDSNFDDVNDDGDEIEGHLSGVVDVYDDNEQAAFGEVNDFNKPLDHSVPMQTHIESATQGALGMEGQGSSRSNTYLSMHTDSESMYTQFDALMKKSWTGDWKILRLNNVPSATTAIKKPKKEKQISTIDFYDSAGEVDEDRIFDAGGANINLPKTQWSSKSRNLLPEDKHFSSESLLSLFLKPKARIGRRRQVKTEMVPDGAVDFGSMDENFWAKHNQEDAVSCQPQNTYGADFFQEGEQMGGSMDDDDDAFEDAKQDFALEGSSEGDFASQLQNLGRKVKPEYVNYAKAAKKVDIRVLKENIWDKLELLSIDDHTSPSAKTTGEDRKFTEVVQSLGDVYPEQAMSEISTSFCFICLLHLANEKGLEIVGDGSMKELTVRRDETVSTIENV